MSQMSKEKISDLFRRSIKCVNDLYILTSLVLSSFQLLIAFSKSEIVRIFEAITLIKPDDSEAETNEDKANLLNSFSAVYL